MPDDPKLLLDIAKKAAVEAGHKVLGVYHSGEFSHHNKDDNSPVTTADYLANEIICERLKLATPHIPIMSEENANEALSVRKHWQRYWLIDPIDGTKEFIVKSGHFAVNIALIENNQPIIGVIYWPVTDTLYFASKGQGAFKHSLEESKQIRVKQLADPEQDTITLAISREQPVDWVMSKMSTTRQYATVPLGSCSLKSCFVAEGKADLFMRIGVTGEWDTGASQCIVAEAGGKILTVNFEPLTYNQRSSLTNPNFIVTGDQRIDWRKLIL